MHDAIYAQPGALRLVGRDNAEALARAARALRGVERLVLAGIGTSWHAALVGELLFAHAGRFGLRARAMHSFELERYWPAPERGTGIIVVSHRGSKRFSREALAKARAGGGPIVAVTGRESEGLAAADVVLATVPQEASSAHTISYTTALALLGHLAARVGGHDDLVHALEGLPDHVALLLGQESWEDLAQRWGARRRYWFVGGGPNRATAYEGALKMSETSYAVADGFEVEQFLHGPWAALEPDDVVFVVAPPGPSHERCLAAARVAKDVGASVIALAREDDAAMTALASETIALPEVDEWLSPILAVVPLQLFAYHTAVLRGANPDTMRADEPAHGRARAGLTL